jgi:hypothetical protein
MSAATHWDTIYTTKAPDAVSWYRAHLDVSLALIERAAPDRSAAIIDVGGGESTLVDDLLARLTRLHWPVDDPAAVEGSEETRKAAFRRIRDQLHGRIMVFLAGDESARD